MCALILFYFFFIFYFLFVCLFVCFFIFGPIILFSVCEEMLTLQPTGMCSACPSRFLFVTEGCGLIVLTVVPRSIHISDLGTMYTNIVFYVIAYL